MPLARPGLGERSNWGIKEHIALNFKVRILIIRDITLITLWWWRSIFGCRGNGGECMVIECSMFSHLCKERASLLFIFYGRTLGCTCFIECEYCAHMVCVSACEVVMIWFGIWWNYLMLKLRGVFCDFPSHCCPKISWSFPSNPTEGWDP